MYSLQVSYYEKLPLDVRMFYDQNVKIDSSKTAKICEKTLGQADNSDWRLLRKFRITASTFHKILRAKKKETRLEYFKQHNKDDDDDELGGEAEWLYNNVDRTHKNHLKSSCVEK